MPFRVEQGSVYKGPIPWRVHNDHEYDGHAPKNIERAKANRFCFHFECIES